MVRRSAARALLRDLLRGARLERGAQIVDLAYVGARETHDERAAMRLLLDEAFGAQQLEGLAHRPPADAELLGDAGLDEALTLREPAGEDLLADAIGDVFGKELACLQRAHLADSLPCDRGLGPTEQKAAASRSSRPRHDCEHDRSLIDCQQST